MCLKFLDGKPHSVGTHGYCMCYENGRCVHCTCVQANRTRQGCYYNKAALRDSSDDDNVRLVSFHGCYNQGAFLSLSIAVFGTFSLG